MLPPRDLPVKSEPLQTAVQELREWVNPPGTEIQVFDDTAASQRSAMRGDIDYYAALEVSRDAGERGRQACCVCVGGGGGGAAAWQHALHGGME